MYLSRYVRTVTFSIVARSDDGLSWGVAVASKFLAVGSAVPAARLGVGAIATQAFANTLYKRDGLAHLVGGRSASETVAALLAADDGREQRQLGVVDAAGRAATFTGTECFDWAGGAHGKRLAGWAPPRVSKTCVECHNPHQPQWDKRAPVHVALTGLAKKP